MRVGVNLLPFRERLAGAGRYAQNVLRELAAMDGQDEFILLVAPSAAAHFGFGEENVRQVVVPLRGGTAGRIVYEQLALPFVLARENVDLLLTMSVAIPAAWRGKKVTVIYDMIAEHREVTKYPPMRNGYVRWMSRYAARHSSAVVTISENSKREIANFARISPKRISIARPATNFERVTDADALARVRERYRLPEKFVLYVGTLEPGKNLTRLVRAYAKMKRTYPDLEQHLVIAGAQGWGVRELEEEINRSEATGFHLIGYVEEEDLAALYSMADLFVYPSLYEGFGMPPLEAMACGTPVIVSNAPALPEVLGELWTGKCAGLLVPPREIDALVTAMWRALKDERLRERLRREGMERVGELSWKRSAGEILRVINHNS
jgi:glycosyltransferase involved in cell wall biosynthesis